MSGWAKVNLMSVTVSKAVKKKNVSGLIAKVDICQFVMLPIELHTSACPVNVYIFHILFF